MQADHSPRSNWPPVLDNEVVSQRRDIETQQRVGYHPFCSVLTNRIPVIYFRPTAAC